MSKLNIVKINLRDVLIYSSHYDYPVLEIQVDFPEYHKKDFNDKNKSIRISACSKLYYLHITSSYSLFITPSLYNSKTIVGDILPIVDNRDYNNIRNVLLRSTKSILIDFLQSKEIYNFSAYKINISNILEDNFESNDVISDFANTALTYLKMQEPDIDISDEEKDKFYKHKIIKEEEE